MKSIILIRHGQSEYQVKGLTSGWTDTDLTELGHRQAVYLVLWNEHTIERLNDTAHLEEAGIGEGINVSRDIR